MIDGKVEKFDKPHLIVKLMKSSKVKDYMKYIKFQLLNESINNYIAV